jgi:general secretion pathway protein M
MQKLKDWFYSLSTRERLMVGGGSVVVVLVAIFTVLGPFYSSVQERGEKVAQKEGDLAWMRSIAGEMLALNASAPPIGTPSGESLVVLIDRAARECGLSSALTGQTPNGETGIRVRLESAEFDKLMVCLGSLQQVHAVNVESATIDRTEQPGLVNASLVLTRPGG